MANSAEIKPEACSNFVPVSSWNYCSVWPVQAGAELDALRTANKALVESVKDRERERDHANDTASAALAENTKLAERVKRLEEAKAAGISLMRAADPFFLNPDDEGDDGISIRQLDESARVTWDEPPTAGEHLALYDAVLEFGRASLETLEAKP